MLATADAPKTLPDKGGLCGRQGDNTVESLRHVPSSPASPSLRLTTMAWQYSHYHPQTSYAQLYGPTAEQYGQNYTQAWYSYYQQHAQRHAAIQPIPTATSTTTPAPANVPVPVPNPPTFSSYNPTFARDSSVAVTGSGAGTGGRGARRQSQLKGLFSKELPKLMYGFGDDKQVAADSVSVMEEILIEYIVDVCQTALAPTRKNRLQIEDLRRVLSRPADAKKLARMEELLFMQEDIKRARKQFEENEMGGGTGDY